VRIVHFSDLHVGSPYFVPNLMNRLVEEVNSLKPDVVVGTGDFTNEGFRQEYKTVQAYFRQFKSKVLAVPGNHDARNVGYLHFEELIGPRHWREEVEGVVFVGVDSTEPDLNSGRVGRERYPWILESFSTPARLKVFCLHHHLIPVPGTGRERNVVYDAGDVLEILLRAGVQLVLTGHKHVPYVWRLETAYIVNAGTAASLRLRGYHRPCYNVIDYDGEEVRIYRRYPFGPESLIAHFSLATGVQYFRELETLIQHPQPAGR
jgi:Icc protein